MWNLLRGIDDDGKARADASAIGASGQVYPDALPMRLSADPPDAVEARSRAAFGEHTYADLIGQPSPRVLTTHLVDRDHLPAELTDPNGRGRLVIVARNLKDALASLHFFHGEAADGWLGNEKGPGSLARFVDPHTENAYGSAFTCAHRPFIHGLHFIRCDDAHESISTSQVAAQR